ncbi:MAG TPA: MotA/TolQ/ExbB proton channel family protein [Planctomycetota bacterium]
MSADPQALSTVRLDSFYDLAVSGGLLMWPIGLCSVLALAWIVERSIRLRDQELGSVSQGRAILDALVAGGVPRALEACAQRPSTLARILRAGLERATRPAPERDLAVEDAGSRELARLGARLRPLAAVSALAPLLGFLGTVFGMIQAFLNIALKDGLGRPELLAAGISQALVTTAAGLCVAIPAQAACFWFRARIDRFAQRSEDLYLELDRALASAPDRVEATS